jgi:hypothetical protein
MFLYFETEISGEHMHAPFSGFIPTPPISSDYALGVHASSSHSKPFRTSQGETAQEMVKAVTVFRTKPEMRSQMVILFCGTCIGQPWVVIGFAEFHCNVVTLAFLEFQYSDWTPKPVTLSYAHSCLPGNRIVSCISKRSAFCSPIPE